MKFKPEGIKHILFDVDGTLYDKNAVKNHAIGSVQTAHDFFKYNAHHLIACGIWPDVVQRILVSEYQLYLDVEKLQIKVDDIPTHWKTEFDALTKQEGSNGAVFDNHHGLKEKGCLDFLHTLLAHIDFPRTIDSNPDIVSTFEHLKSKNYDLGILTTEVFRTVESVALAVGFDIRDFYIGTNPEHPLLGSKYGQRYLPVICRDNVMNSKPNTEAFEKALAILDGPIVYVGDSLSKDVIPALSVGMYAIHLRNKGSYVKAVQTKDCREYLEIGSILDLKEVFK